MDIKQYIRNLNAQLAGGDATEHSHRKALEVLLSAAVPGALVTNEPKQIPCGAPDFLLKRGEIRLGYVETKNIGKNLDDKSYKEQFKRYASALDNLIITDYLEFRLLRDGKRATSVCIGEVRGKRIKARHDNFAALEDLLAAFASHDGVSITTADELAAHMAAKARMLAAAIADSLIQDENSGGGRELQDQLHAFRKLLIHDIQPADFADLYAQTIAYGMFAARLHDDTEGAFTRKKAADLIPPANPFLRKFFKHTDSDALDKRIRWAVDELALLFRIADVGELMAEYGKKTRRTDPFLHFYETFLGAYNPKLRKSRGVYYTPEPVVEFIVRAVDDILRDEFGLQNGIAATDKTTIEIEAAGDATTPKKSKEKLEKEILEMHKVQILDPATGTGTFLAAIVRHIHEKYFARKQQGQWKNYVRENLIPRLNGFEILMAPYVMAHIKLDMTLDNTGCKLDKDRARIFLTNALEEHHPDTTTLMARWLSDEANAANEIKRGEKPVMVVIGNPPYSGVSSNMNDWINGLIENYKYVDGEHFGERKHWLHDDYVKFIAYGQHYIDRTNYGVLAYISNNGFLDNPTFRGMRWNLLQTFDKIFIVDLHGSVKKKETASDGSADENVFDISQGVSINFFVKTGKKQDGALARVFHSDIYGTREKKYADLQTNNLGQIDWAELLPKEPFYFFVPKDWENKSEYDEGFSLNKLFPQNTSGIVTMGDSFMISDSKKEMAGKLKDFLSTNYSEAEFKAKYSLGKNYSKWVTDNKASIIFNQNEIVPIAYRPFDARWTVYNSKLLWRWRKKIMSHFLAEENIGLISIRRARHSGVWKEIFVTDKISAGATAISSLDMNYAFPLYLYPDSAQTELDDKPARKPNLDEKIVTAIATQTGLQFTPEKHSPADAKYFAPIDLLDYIYAILHSPAYRAKFNEFLKIDFPRVPYPTDAKHFWKFAKLGGKLRAMHLMEATPKTITTYPVAGDDTITTRIGKDDFKITDAKKLLGRVRINDKQYFGDIPKSAWNFYIGGYQPAQKYLKDRRGRQLSSDEITHYQNIIAVLAETEKVMAEIDKVLPV